MSRGVISHAKFLILHAHRMRIHATSCGDTSKRKSARTFLRAAANREICTYTHN
jgi:hypothetical protein